MSTEHGIDDEVMQRYEAAKSAYQRMAREDFPDFDPESAPQPPTRVSGDNADETDSAEEPKTLQERIGRLVDLNGDGRIGLDDLEVVPKVAGVALSAGGREIGETAQSALRWVKSAAQSFDVSKAGADAQRGLNAVAKAFTSIDARGNAAGALHIGETAIGIRGLRDRAETKRVLDVCHEYYDAAEVVTEERRRRLNFEITDFGTYRLHSLHSTVGRFLEYLDQLHQRNAHKEYEILAGLSIDTQTLDEMKNVDMTASKVLGTTGVATLAGAAAVFGTPVLVTGAVSSFAAASTGTAISSLSGVAATNATMAWLGGGSLAAGGGGMAAGAAALTAITAGATAVVAVLSAGTIVSVHYGKKLSEAKQYEKDVGVLAAGLEKAWAVMDGISQRVAELRDVTEELKWRTANQLDQLEELIPEFDFDDMHSVTVFNICGRFIKTMAELAQTPLFDQDGNLSTDSLTISAKVRTVLNTEV
jgi:hypothetical protein